MKIIKEGCIPNPKNIRRFKCENCGCEFEANPDEYFENDNVIASLYCTSQIYSYSNCPNCHKMCSVGRPSYYGITTTNLHTNNEEPIDFKDIISGDSSTSTTYTFTLKSDDDEDVEEED